MIKSIKKITVQMGVVTIGGEQYFTWGSATSISSNDYDVRIHSPDGSVAKFCFVYVPVPYDPHKTFITHSFTGHTGGNQGCKFRIYGTNGYPPSSSTAHTQMQLTQSGNFPLSTFRGTVSQPPSVSIEIVEFL